MMMIFERSGYDNSLLLDIPFAKSRLCAIFLKDPLIFVYADNYY
jgi:hypothetical protein